MYDRSEKPVEGSIVVPNIGSDIFDKFSYIIDNYNNLPDVAVYTKCNIFKYISKEEWDKICNNQTFTPILTQNHRTYSDEQGVVNFYKDGMYYERNDLWYIGAHPTRTLDLWYILGLDKLDFIPFAPGSNYILPKENILKHSKEFYEKLRAYLDWTIYPGEAQIMERGLYILWR